MSSLIDTCLGISGTFEGGPGTPRWDLLTGNFDQMGISVGCLQWNTGTGSIQNLLKMVSASMDAQTQFASILKLRGMRPAQATSYAVAQWVDPKSPRGNLLPQAILLWRAFLTTPEVVAAQRTLAYAILQSGMDEAEHFLPWLTTVDARTAAFFFDLHVQQGGMVKRMADGSRQVPPILTDPSQAQPQIALDFAVKSGNPKTADAWKFVIANGDTLAAVLLHYAYARAAMSRPEYVWDTLSRRGTIACRVGHVHGADVNLTGVLP